ncbi:MAG: hypothetical protein JWL69_3529 [Phycisphaerales bacterium]|nr:hypothetical protein [Phycisphaerales bacterium]
MPPKTPLSASTPPPNRGASRRAANSTSPALPPEDAARPLTAGQGFILLAFTLLLACGAIYALLKEFSNLGSQGSRTLIMIVFTGMGLVVAAAMFGVIRGVGGIIQGTLLKAKYEFRGAAAIVVFFVLVGLYVLYAVPKPDQFDVLVECCSMADEIIPCGGSIDVYDMKRGMRSADIFKGEARISELSMDYVATSHKFILHVDGYHPKDKEIMMQPSGSKPIHLRIIQNTAPPTIISTTQASITEMLLEITLEFRDPTRTIPVDGVLQVRAQSAILAPIVHGIAKFNVSGTEAGKTYDFTANLPGYEVKSPAQITLDAHHPIVINVLPPQIIVPAVDEYKLLWFDHNRPGQLFEVLSSKVELADVHENTFHTWCRPFDESRYDILERRVVAKDEHFKEEPNWWAKKPFNLPALNERWFQIMDDEVWYIFKVRRRS